MCVPANSVKRGPSGNWGGGAAAPADPPVAPALDFVDILGKNDIT